MIIDDRYCTTYNSRQITDGLPLPSPTMQHRHP